MKLRQRLDELVRACFSGIWVETQEASEALREIAELCHEQAWQLVSWDVDQGVSAQGQTAMMDTTSNDPLAAIKALPTLAEANDTTLLVLRNFHRFLGSTEVVEAVTRAILEGKIQRTILVVLAPVVKLPVELEKLFVVVDHTYPTSDQLLSIAREIAVEPGELPEDQQLEQLLEAAAGQTRQLSPVELAGDVQLDTIDAECVLATRIRVFPIFERDAGGSGGRIVVSYVDASQHLGFSRRN